MLASWSCYCWRSSSYVDSQLTRHPLIRRAWGATYSFYYTVVLSDDCTLQSPIFLSVWECCKRLESLNGEQSEPAGGQLTSPTQFIFYFIFWPPPLRQHLFQPLAFIGDNKPCFVITAVRTHAVLSLLVSCFEWWIQQEQPGGTEGYFLVTQAQRVGGRLETVCVSRFDRNSKKFTPLTWRVVKVISGIEAIESDFCFQPSVCLSVCEYVSV